MQALECNLFQHKYIKPSQEKARNLEKSNTTLRKELAETKAATDAMKKKVKEAKREAKGAKRAVIDAYKDSVVVLENEKVALVDHLEGVAFEAMINKRSRLMA